MENPLRDIGRVINALTMGTPAEQKEALYANFLPDASFVHPFCRVPSFAGRRVPWLGDVDSRQLILGIFRWYKFMSPDIDLVVESAVYNQRAGLLFATIHQKFSLWFIPFYRADVRLVTILRLAQCQLDDHGAVRSARLPGGKTVTYNNPAAASASARSPASPSGYWFAATRGSNGAGGSATYAAVVADGSAATTSGSSSSASTKPRTTRKPNNRSRSNSIPEEDEEYAAAAAENGGGGSSTSSSSSRTTRYMIAQQEDLYQVNEFFKFVAPGLLDHAWTAWQVLSALVCGLLWLVTWPVGRALRLDTWQRRRTQQQAQRH